MKAEKEFQMAASEKRRSTFALRLPKSLKDAAEALARQDGVALNHFISLAVAEKVSRLSSHAAVDSPIKLEQGVRAK
jgi:predicted HicB family RNase H-like nuclease